jgi:hypothetical protein
MTQYVEKTQKSPPPGHQHEYHILIDQKPYTWADRYITGTQIKALASVDQAFGVWLEAPGPEDPPVGNDEPIDLDKPGVERFFTGKKQTTEGV